MIKFSILYCPDITTNLKNKKLSVREVEDWKVSIPSYDIFPTVPLTFDKVFWEASWPIVNEPVLDVRKVLMKPEKERKEMEMEKIKENRQKLEREEADRLDAKKNKRSLDLGRGKKLSNLPPNCHYQTHLPLPLR